VTHIFASVTVPTDYTYRVWVDDKWIDTSGVAHNVTSSATVTVTPHGFTVQIQRGWNMITIPVQGGDYKASTLGLNMFDGVVGWNPSTQTYDKNYIVGLPTADFTLESSTSYWVFANGPRTLFFEGACPTVQQSTSFSTGGWITVGLCSLNTGLHASDLVSMYSGAAVSGVAMWDASAQRFITYIPGLPTDNFALVPGQGYWMMVSGAGTFTYNP
jgi:hypothetical protein